MDYTVIDLEMTGLSARADKIIEIGAVKVRGGTVTAAYGTLVAPGRPIPPEVTELTGITDEMAAAGCAEDEALDRLLELIGGDVLVGHNVSFDYSFIKQWAVNHRRSLSMKAMDTLKIARELLPKEQSKKLKDLCTYFQIPRGQGHRALDDALATQRLFECLLPMALERNGMPPAPRELVCKVKRQTPATAHQIERLMEYRAKHGISEPIVWETLTRSEASRTQDKYYSIYGRD